MPWSAGSTISSQLTMPLRLSILSSTLPLAGGSCVPETMARSVANPLLSSQDTPALWARYPMAGVIIPFGRTATRLLGAATLMCSMEIYLNSRRLLVGVRFLMLREIEERIG